MDTVRTEVSSSWHRSDEAKLVHEGTALDLWGEQEKNIRPHFLVSEKLAKEAVVFEDALKKAFAKTEEVNNHKINLRRLALTRFLRAPHLHKCVTILYRKTIRFHSLSFSWRSVSRKKMRKRLPTLLRCKNSSKTVAKLKVACVLPTSPCSNNWAVYLKDKAKAKNSRTARVYPTLPKKLRNCDQSIRTCAKMQRTWRLSQSPSRCLVKSGLLWTSYFLLWSQIYNWVKEKQHYNESVDADSKLYWHGVDNSWKRFERRAVAHEKHLAKACAKCSNMERSRNDYIMKLQWAQLSDAGALEMTLESGNVL